MSPESTRPASSSTEAATLARRRWLWVAVAAVVAVAVVVALVIAVRDSPGAQLGRAIDRTLAAETARASITGSVEDVPVVGTLEVAVADGDLDLAGQRARLEREVPFMSELQLPGLGAAGPAEVVFADGGAWVRVPFDTDRWLQLRDPDDPTAPADEEATIAPGLGNPLAVLGLLRAVEANPDEVAVDDIAVIDGDDGRTRFAVVVDLDAVDDVGGEAAEAIVATARRIAVDGTVPLTVTLDDEGRLAEVRLDGTVDVAGLTELDVTTTLELHDYGAAVNAERPPDDLVLSRDQLPELDLELPELDPLEALSEWLDDLPFP